MSAPPTLRDLAVPIRGAAPEAASISRTIPKSDAAALKALSGKRGWLADSALAGAWVLAADFLTGAGEFSLRESDRAVPAQAIDRTLPLGQWIDALDAERRRVHDPGKVSCGDFRWGQIAAALDENFPMAVGPGEANDRLEARYLPAVYGADLVDCLLAVTATVLHALAEDSGTPIEKLPMLSETDAHTLFRKWNAPLPAVDPAASVVTTFRAMAKAHAKRPALRWHAAAGVGTMDYSTLDTDSDTVARRLIATGVKPGDAVALAMPRSAGSIVVLLGILKAGAAYVPIDLRYPAERIRFMLADAGAARIVVVPGQAPELPTGCVAMDLDALLAPATPGESATALPAVGDGAAYLMYTSGSTGTPKGIVIEHHAILRLVIGADFTALTPDTVFLHAAPLGFDASTLEIWGPLLNGGVCAIHHEDVPTGAGLARSIAALGTTSAWLTAALFNAMVDDEPKNLEGLRELLAGGEALSVPHILRALKALPGTTLINGYGPTECTTFTATCRIPRDLPADSRSIPIGLPVAATPVFVVNARLEPVPPGMVGELCVGGNGVARGYLNRPDLNAEKFIANPFPASGDKLYRTGDLVRFLPDGRLEFIGRRDGQVKIRGFRIETGEIETAIAKHPSVQANAVIVREDIPGAARLVAYVVAKGAFAGAVELRKFLAPQLPEFMIPAAFVALDRLPVTGNGKLDKRALPRPDNQRPELTVPFQEPDGAMEQRLARLFADVLGLDRAGRHDNFFELGGTSLLVLQALSKLQRELGRPVAATVFFSNPTPAAIAAALSAKGESISASRLASTGRSGAHDPIAIIAMAGRFPGANDVESFWQNLLEGKESITHFDKAALDPSLPASLTGDENYVAARGVIEGIDQFDAAFFGIPPKEAELMDPQQRVFLELAWEVLERGGYAPDSCPFPVGVFAGMYNATYFQKHVMHHPEKIARVGDFQVMLANEKDYIATRTANRLNLTGPAVSVHTACSTSLVAIAQAVAALRAGQCEMALAGGASVTCPPNSGYLYQEGAMLSPDGRTRTFDAEAQGTVFSDGAAVVLLKRLADAERDGDTVFAVIRGVAVNNDGGAKASFTAPSVDGQAAVIAAALADAGVNARSVSYVEAHGTATPLGDPIEVEALTKAYRRDTPDTGFCRIGSAKSNIGHTVIAAGATGVIKTALALATETLPPSIGFATPNPKIDFAGSPFLVNDKTFAWTRSTGGEPRRAGVSSFGVGGTNAHAVLEEAPVQASSEPATGPQLLLLSARTDTALSAAKLNLSARLARSGADSPSVNLADAAYTLRVGRKAFAERVALVASTPAEAAAILKDGGAWLVGGKLPTKVPEVVFMFPGQGSQYSRMGCGLYESEPEFRAAFDECIEALQGVTAFDMKERMLSDDPAALTDTAITQPALFIVEYATARLMMSLGVKPAVMIGHSVGEFVAATLAGVFAPADAVRLVARRGALMQSMPPGRMLAVRVSAASLEPRLPPGVSLAAENSPGLCVVAGPFEAVDAFQAALEKDGIGCRALVTSHAFHSAMMEPAVAPFEAELAKVNLSPPSIPIQSTTTGRPLSDAEATDPRYWSAHLREPVRFSSALTAMLATPDRCYLELGPRATLATLVRQHASKERPAPPSCATLNDAPGSETAAVRLAAGRLWTLGIETNLAHFEHGRRRRILLPTTAFDRQRFWVDAAAPVPIATAPVPAMPVGLSPLTALAAQPAALALPTFNLPVETPPMTSAPSNRVPELAAKLTAILEEVSGVDLGGAPGDAPFVELGLDSLSLTQVAIQVKQNFKVNVTFRQLMETHRSVDALARHLDQQLPAAAPAAAAPAAAAAPTMAAMPMMAMPAMGAAPGGLVEQVIAQQMQLMSQQLAMLRGGAFPTAAAPSPVASAPTPTAAPTPVAEDEGEKPVTKYDVKKAFGAIARIHSDKMEITERQKVRLDAFMRRYIAKTKKSKDYTVQHRAKLADPRVVNGFRPILKEIIYQIVIGKSKAARMWDLDGNEYIDVLNGFGMNMFGWQPDFVVEAVKKQVDEGYDIGPQHPLAGEVADLICELTGNDRAALCNTGSEAVMGAVRVARTVTGRNTIAIFTGAYHGIFDEVIVRATKKHRAVPAAPGILPNTSQNVVVLDYGTPESMEFIKANIDDLAAVLVEPVQSRRPDFRPVDFLKELRGVTEKGGALLIFDEVVTGFRSHPGGIQSLFDIRADLVTYGKVVGGGFPIGVIAGKREFMDALDGGHWEYGDDSIPTVGVTYFAGTFVRHPLALAAAKASLLHMKEKGPALQAELTRRTTAMVDDINAYCQEVGAPVVVKSFASVWRTFFTEDHPLQDLLFAAMRSRGIHILDNFPCFMTTAHSEADMAVIAKAFKESIAELQEADFLPRRADAKVIALDASKPPVPGARIGKDPDGKPAWYIPNPDSPGKYLKLEA